MKHLASIIAKGDPPDWLVRGLERLAIRPDLTTKERQDYQDIVERMRKATDTLLDNLPIFFGVPWGARCPPDVTRALAALPGVKRALDPAKGKPKTGRPSNVQREMCAAVVLEAWKLCHGKAEPRSLKLEQACEEYWQAWGRKPTGDPESRRRVINRAQRENYRAIGTVLERYKTPTK